MSLPGTQRQDSQHPNFATFATESHALEGNQTLIATQNSHSIFSDAHSSRSDIAERTLLWQ